jgi:CDP-glycerol glycerophosphotransferase
VYKEGFCWNKDIYQLGHPRNDVFFYSKEKQQEIKEKVFAKYNIDANKKILLYAPSFRDDKKINVYNLDFKIIVDSLKSKFGGEWVVMVRLHANLLGLRSQPKIFNYSEGVIDASFYPDMQELLVTADVGITDFSSWIFDYMLSRKPAFIYAEDIDEYNTERGFYYPLESTPFPVAKNNEKLAQNIIDFDYDKYKNEIETFLQGKGCIEDGHASERVVDLIEKIIDKGYNNKNE